MPRRRVEDLGAFDARLATPFAVLGIRTAAEQLTDIVFLPLQSATLDPRNALAEKTCAQLLRYLDDPQFRFELPFVLDGTPFQCRVWRQICAIPAGRTRSYGEIAKALRSAARAVGAACGDNRIPLVIPCHRVVGAGGLGGFMHSRDGLPLRIKRWLLTHEGC